MKPLKIACPCGNIVTIMGVILTCDFGIHLLGYCANCHQMVRWESTLPQLAERCAQISEPNKPLRPPLQSGYTEEDIALLKGMKISDKPPI